MRCLKCGSEEFYKAEWEKGEVFLVCFKCRERYPLQSSEQTKEAEAE